MMLRPTMDQIMKKGDNYYEFVVKVAKKARQIARRAEEDKLILEEKPVQLAVKMMANYPEEQ